MHTFINDNQPASVFEELAGVTLEGDDLADLNGRSVKQAIDAQLLAIASDEATLEDVDVELALMDDDELEAFIGDLVEWPEATVAMLGLHVPAEVGRKATRVSHA